GFLRLAERAVRLFDVNLRQQFFTAQVLEESCALATVVKLNEEELPQVHQRVAPSSAATTEDQRVDELRTRFDLEAVVLTRGAAGTVLYTSVGKTTSAPPRYPRDPAADSVGAGDACTAGILVGRLLDWPPERTIALANAAGAFVASQPGATP